MIEIRPNTSRTILRQKSQHTTPVWLKVPSLFNRDEELDNLYLLGTSKIVMMHPYSCPDFGGSGGLITEGLTAALSARITVPLVFGLGT